MATVQLENYATEFKTMSVIIYKAYTVVKYKANGWTRAISALGVCGELIHSLGNFRGVRQGMAMHVCMGMRWGQYDT